MRFDGFGVVDLHRRVARGEFTPEQAAWLLMQRKGRWEMWKIGLTTGLILGSLLTNLALWILGEVSP